MSRGALSCAAFEQLLQACSNVELQYDHILLHTAKASCKPAMHLCALLAAIEQAQQRAGVPRTEPHRQPMCEQRPQRVLCNQAVGSTVRRLQHTCRTTAHKSGSDAHAGGRPDTSLTATPTECF